MSAGFDRMVTVRVYGYSPNEGEPGCVHEGGCDQYPEPGKRCRCKLADMTLVEELDVYVCQCGRFYELAYCADCLDRQEQEERTCQPCRGTGIPQVGPVEGSCGFCGGTGQRRRLEVGA